MKWKQKLLHGVESTFSSIEIYNTLASRKSLSRVHKRAILRSAIHSLYKFSDYQKKTFFQDKHYLTTAKSTLCQLNDIPPARTFSSIPSVRFLRNRGTSRISREKWTSDRLIIPLQVENPFLEYTATSYSEISDTFPIQIVRLSKENIISSHSEISDTFPTQIFRLPKENIQYKHYLKLPSQHTVTFSNISSVRILRNRGTSRVSKSKSGFQTVSAHYYTCIKIDKRAPLEKGCRFREATWTGDISASGRTLIIPRKVDCVLGGGSRRHVKIARVCFTSRTFPRYRSSGFAREKRSRQITLLEVGSRLSNFEYVAVDVDAPRVHCARVDLLYLVKRIMLSSRALREYEALEISRLFSLAVVKLKSSLQRTFWNPAIFPDTRIRADLFGNRGENELLEKCSYPLGNCLRRVELAACSRNIFRRT